jgi:hypothetical protein
MADYERSQTVDARAGVAWPKIEEGSEKIEPPPEGAELRIEGNPAVVGDHPPGEQQRRAPARRVLPASVERAHA